MASVDPSTCGTVRGVVEVVGNPSPPKLPQVRGDAWCVAHHPAVAAADSPLIVHDGKLANVFVWVESGLERYTFDPPTGKVVLDQHDCAFQPRVLGARVRQPITILNSDPILHNVHAKPRHNPDRNVALPGRGTEQDFEFPRPEVMIPVSCDVHPWMRAYIGVVAHPFFAVTGDDGSFELASLPAGRYTLGVWHETLGRRDVEFEVVAGAQRNLGPIVYQAP